MAYKKFIIFLTLLSVVVFGIIIAVSIANKEEIKPEVNNPKPIIKESIYRKVDYNRTNDYEIKVIPRTPRQIVWIPDWGMAEGMQSLKVNYKSIDSVSPVWYYLNKDGSVKANKTRINELLSFTEPKGIEVIPTIASFDPEEFKASTKDSQTLDQHVNFLLNEVKKYNFDGLDLDYEAIYFENQDEYFQLISKLSNGLKAMSKKLTIAVLSKWSEDNIYTGLVQTRNVQNWSLLAEYVDEIRLMAYDYTSRYSKVPGPVAPLDWQEAIVNYALRYFPPEKIYLGSNLYGYVWEYKSKMEPKAYNSYVQLDRNDTRLAASLYSALLEERFTKNNGQVVDDLKTGENVFKYKGDGKEWIAFSPGVESQKKRINLVKEYGLGGIAYWKLGGENSDIITLIK